MARDQGFEIPQDFELPAELAEKFTAAHATWETSRRAVEAVRQPIVQEVTARKAAAGDYEEFPNPGSLDGEAARELHRRILEIRRPTALDQTVVTAGNSKVTRFIRVNLADDPRLPPVYQQLHTAEHEYVTRVHRWLSPYLPR